jgi:hypothetical protein
MHSSAPPPLLWCGSLSTDVDGWLCECDACWKQSPPSTQYTSLPACPAPSPDAAVSAASARRVCRWASATPLLRTLPSLSLAAWFLRGSCTLRPCDSKCRFPIRFARINAFWKHIVKHIVVPFQKAICFLNSSLIIILCPSKSGLMNKHIVNHISGLMIHFWVPCARLSPD